MTATTDTALIGFGREAAAALRGAAGLKAPALTLDASSVAAAFRHGDLAAALAAMRELAAAAPDDPDVMRMLGLLLTANGQHDEAIVVLVRAGVDRSEDPALLLVLARAYEAAGQLDDALVHAEYAAELDSGSAARSIVARLRYSRGTRGEYVERAPPGPPEPEPPAFQHLRAGRLADGFQALLAMHDELQDIPGAPHLQSIRGPVPRWAGERCGRLLAVVDQGFGDSLQFCRYLHAALEHCDRLVAAARPELLSLLECSGFEAVSLFSMETELAAADAYVTAMLIPAVLPGVGYGATARYLTAAAPVELPADGMLRIGLCWAGNPAAPQDARRSASVADLAPLEGVPGCRFYSLMQRDSVRPEWIEPSPLPLVDFAATARVVQALDLVITVDTSVAHLAGALGKPVWIALAHGDGACWRWGTHPTRSSWYSTAVLCRQRAPGDWRETFQHMASELEHGLLPWTVSVPLLKAEECDLLLAYAAAREFTPGLLAEGHRDNQHRRCRELRIDPADPALAWLWELFRPAAAQAAAQLGITTDLTLIEPPTIARYQPGDHFGWHVDGHGEGRRLLSCTIQLSGAGDYQGGSLEVMQPSGTRCIEAPRERGHAVFFESRLLHAVQPIQAGQRCALVIWLANAVYARRDVTIQRSAAG